MARVTTYNPKKVKCALGNHIVEGYADDSFITVELDGDGTTYVAGCDGEVARSVDPNSVYKLSLTLLQFAETNDWLESKYEKDRKDGGGTFSVQIKDASGDESFAGSVAWVSKPASWERGKTQATRQWEIIVGEGVFR